MSPTPQYAGFISYNSSGNRRLAAALQRRIERFARPWYGRRGLRLYRDTTNLGGGELPPSLVAALEASEWFLLLASPEAARSSWAQRQLTWWREHRSPDRVIVVLLGGRLRWDANAGDFDWSETNALPAAARGMFTAEPRWVDLTSVGDEPRLDRDNPDVFEALAKIVAALRGVDRPGVVADHLTRRRLARRERTAGAALLAAVLVTALAVTAVTATSANRAQAREAIATARALAGASQANLDTRAGLAQLLAVEAYRQHPDPTTRAALFQAVSSSPALQRSLIATGPVTRIAAAADLNPILAGTADGDVLRWDARGRRDVLARLGTGVTALAISPDGQAVAAGSDTDAIVWTRATGVRPLDLHGARPTAVAVSSSGRTAVLVTPDALSVTDLSTMDTRRVALAHPYQAAVLPADDVVVLNSADGSWSRFAVSTLAPLDSGRFPSPGLPAISGDGRLFGYADPAGTVSVWSSSAPLLSAPGPRPSALALSTQGAALATAVGGTITLTPLRPQATPLRLTGLPTVNPGALSFLDDGSRLIAASGTDVVLFDASQPGRITRRSPLTSPPSLAGALVSPDRRYAVLPGSPATLLDLQSGQTQPLPAAGIAWLWIGGELLSLAPNGELTLGPPTAAPRVTFTDPSPPSTVRALAASPDGRRLTYVDSAADGSARVAVRDLTDGHAIADIPVPRTVGSAGTTATASAGNSATPSAGTAAPSAGAAGIPVPGASGSAGNSAPGAVGVAAVDRNAELAAIAGPDGVSIVDTRTSTIATIPGPAAAVALGSTTLAVLRPNGEIDLYTGGADPRKLRTLPALDAPITEPGSPSAPTTGTPSSGATGGAVALSADGTLLAQLQSDGQIALRDTDTGTGTGTGEPMGTIPGPAPLAFAFGADGTTLAVTRSASLDLWNLNPSDWVRTACASANRDLTRFEWQQFVGTTSPDNLRCLR